MTVSPSARGLCAGVLITLVATGPALADEFRIEKARWKGEDHKLIVVGKGRDDRTVTIANAGSGAEVGTTEVHDDDWYFREYDLASVPCRISATQEGGGYQERDVEDRPSDCDDGSGGGGGGPGGGGASNVSINSTSANSAAVLAGTTPADVGPVPQQEAGGSGYQVLAINDLGMHCGDYDTRISSILPPFQVLLAQVVRKGGEPDLMGPDMVDVYYSAASNPDDPILDDPQAFPGRLADGHVYKTNFWDVIPKGAYDPFYPAFNPFNPAQALTPLAGAPFTVTTDESLPVPNVEDLYIGHDGLVNSGDEFLSAVQHAMPGIDSPYLVNVPQKAEEHYAHKPFFVNFPFGYVANDVAWFEGGGIPLAAFDDFGRENAYPLVRVQARDKTGQLLATVDTVLPISGEASCNNCHAHPADAPDSPTAGVATAALADADLPVATHLVDPEEGTTVPLAVSIEYAADINLLRLHDLKHGDRYVAPDGSAADCVIDADNPEGNANCLINKALVQDKPVVCQVCHYTPALDLAQLGPLAGPPGTVANGRNQLAHQSNSRVMHSHHGSLTDGDGNKLFPDMPAPVQDASGTITNHAERVAVLEQTCYQCHPGRNVRCLRGAMFNGGMLCNDCHGNMEQVGEDFTAGVSPDNPGAFKLGLGNFYDHTSAQPRVPWANEPGCGSCHTGDALDNALVNGDVDPAEVIVNTADIRGNPDGIRLRQAYRSGDAKATPIVPSNKRFAEDPVPATFNGFANPGAGNPKLYRVSVGGVESSTAGVPWESGHGGIFCEGCHGATHAEWPNAIPQANDNVTANQLQGHTGVIIECGTCHEGDLGNTLEGPHGMHPVGDVDFVNGGHEHMAENNLQACAACHGDRGQGTVLSVAKTKRSGLEDLEGTIARGEAVGCGRCHGNPFNEDSHEEEHH